ncbi:hypothetical protein RJ640_024438 [Escallonia rubra]|uniref:CCHC-type domain-containing protein n=1 Tax=Escallonia rubra TaxID=112253 RepID=A0AA88UMR8_9ASTE|nr:hypothetical protein RJ640_024438 [Escallonia rubra]
MTTLSIGGILVVGDCDAAGGDKRGCGFDGNGGWGSLVVRQVMGTKEVGWYGGVGDGGAENDEGGIMTRADGQRVDDGCRMTPKPPLLSDNAAGKGVYTGVGSWVFGERRMGVDESAVVAAMNAGGLREEHHMLLCKGVVQNGHGRGRCRSRSRNSGHENDKSKSRGKQDKSSIECWYCKEIGHIARKCPERKDKKNGKKHVNNANVAEEDDKSSDGDLYLVSSVEQQ